ncbi:coilin-like isoform X2 [Phalaenopsis equestris]|uniref:coilin-like isoform X2 n=1 Tax=Phalaenopsis equestris TaxID=78828 RepID=UPI0009E3DA0A|nr:coilin-like isoform X2 [Phalaenopsis equestris]
MTTRDSPMAREEKNDGNMVRFRLIFDDPHLLDKSQRSLGLRRCWFLLKPDITVIGDLASQIRECFGLRHRIVLSMDDFVLPSFESTSIIKEKDIVRVKRKEAKQKDICKPNDGQNIFQDSENAGVQGLDFSKNLLVDGYPQENSLRNGSYDKDVLTLYMENSIHQDPPGEVGSTKPKRKCSKKLSDSMGQNNESNHENEFEPSNDSDVRKKKKAVLQMVPHSSEGEEDVVASVVQPDHVHFLPQEHGAQQADEPQKPALFDGGSSIKESDRDKQKTFPQAKVDGAPVSDGILPLPKSGLLSLAVDKAKPLKQVITFEILVPLRRLPVKGDILAYRCVEPSSSMYPQLSSPQVGEVSSFDYKTLQIILLPAVDYVFSLDEIPRGTIGQPNASRYKEDGSLEIEFLSLVDVRLVKAHDQEKEKNCEDDQAVKDNWEEASLKGSGNEPNASTAEQSNSWAQWNSNKNATAMPSSLSQPITHFPGRNSGRRGGRGGRRAPVRGMDNRIPNRNAADWNPRRNHGARNPNWSNTGVPPFDNPASLPWPYGGAELPPHHWEHHQNNSFFPGDEFLGPGKW